MPLHFLKIVSNGEWERHWGRPIMKYLDFTDDIAIFAEREVLLHALDTLSEHGIRAQRIVGSLDQD